MMWLDYILLFVLVLLIVVATVRRVVWLRILTVILLFVVALFFEMSLDAMARAVVTQRTREGRWTRDYTDGAYDTKNWVRTFRPYRLIAVAGLAFLAFKNAKRTRHQNDGRPAPGERDGGK